MAATDEEEEEEEDDDDDFLEALRPVVFSYSRMSDQGKTKVDFKRIVHGQ